MMTLFDTDVLIWALRGNKKALDAVDAAEDRGISAVTYMELLRGAKDKRDFASTKRFVRLGGFSIFPITEAITERAVAIIEALALSNAIAPSDALVFATALQGGFTLCSGNYRHFKDIAGLESDIFRP